MIRGVILNLVSEFYADVVPAIFAQLTLEIAISLS